MVNYFVLYLLFYILLFIVYSTGYESRELIIPSSTDYTILFYKVVQTTPIHIVSNPSSSYIPVISTIPPISTQPPDSLMDLHLRLFSTPTISITEKPRVSSNFSSLSFVPKYLFIDRHGIRGRLPCNQKILNKVPDNRKHVISTDIKLRPENQYLLSVVLSDEKSHIPSFLKRTLELLSYYQNHFPFRALMVSSSPAIQTLCEELHIRFIPSVETNPYGLPLVRSLFIALRDCFTSDYYGYLNSDILLSPDVFYILETLHSYKAVFTPSGYLVAARVHNSVDQHPLPQNMDDLYEYMHNLGKGKLRQPNSADVFFLPSYYDFETLPGIVIGRWFIDNVMVQQTFLKNQHVIDISYVSKSIHQGYSGQSSLQKTIESENFMYNGKYLKKNDRRIGLHVSPLVLCPVVNDPSV